MKRKAIIPLVLGLGVGLVTVKYLVDTIRTAQASGQSTDTVTVVRATQDINAYEEITVDKVEVVKTVDNLLAPANDRVSTLEEIKGRVAAKSIPGRAAVLKSMLAPEGTRPGMVGRIPPGYRAVSVKIDEVTGVAYQIQPGDWVDVIVVMDIDDSTARGKKQTVAEVILQHVQVAAIGHTTNTVQDGTSKVKPAKSATLFVREEDVPKLHLAGTRGKITLAMRGDDERMTYRPTGAMESDLFARMRPGNETPGGPGASSFLEALLGGFGPSKPEASEPKPNHSTIMQPETVPDPPHAVLVYRGSGAGGQDAAVEQITFENAQSSRIIEVSAGLPTRAGAMIRGIQDSPRIGGSRLSPSVSRSRKGNDKSKTAPSGGE